MYYIDYEGSNGDFHNSKVRGFANTQNVICNRLRDP